MSPAPPQPAAPERRARDTQRKTPRPHNKLLAHGPPTEHVGDAVSKVEPTRPYVAVRLLQSPAHVSSIPGSDTPEEEPSKRMGRNTESVCLLSACEVVAKVKSLLSWHKVTSTSQNGGRVLSQGSPELSLLPL